MIPSPQPAGAGWYADPCGRHDARYWSGTDWTQQVADAGLVSADAIEPVEAVPAAIRPSWEAFWSSYRSFPWWRWALAAALLLFMLLLLYSYAGFPLVGAGVALLLLLNVGLPILTINVMRLEADTRGVSIRNQLGYVRFIPRERIAAVSVGKAWIGGVQLVDVAFIVSTAGAPLGRFFLRYWKLDDFRRLANALGMRLYGRPGRQLDAFHSARSAERGAKVLVGSVVVGGVAGFVLPLLFLMAVLIAVLLHSGHR